MYDSAKFEFKKNEYNQFRIIAETILKFEYFEHTILGIKK